MANIRTAFLNPSAVPATPARMVDRFVAVWLKLWVLVVIFSLTIFGCAALYYVGSSYGWGIQPTFTATPMSVSFGDCLHFSVVTIATLGYGDFRPVSYGRLIAALEVLTGLLLMGVFISRLVSRQQDQLTKRLATGQLNDEIQRFRDKLAGLLDVFRSHPPVLAVASPSQLLHDTGALAKSIGSYWRHEAEHADLAAVLPVRAASRLIGDLITVMGVISSSVAGKVRADLHPKDVIAINRVAESSLTVATVLADHIVDQSTAHLYDRVSATVNGFRTQLGRLPRAKKSSARSRRRERREKQHQ